jgi:capsular polysaccharide biosynthesis protein
MLDLLPKFSVLQASGVRLDSIDYFVVRVKSEFQRETLQHLGIEASKLIEPWGDGFTKCENLYVPFIKHDRGDRFYNGLGLGMARWVPEWLKSTFLEKPINDKLKNTKLYISRAKRGTRSPADENHLIRLLEQRGFRSVQLETLSVMEQAHTLSSADFVIAPHGAGLSNISFCNPRTIVIEIFGEYVVPCYWALSELCGLDYHAYFAAHDCKEREDNKPCERPLTMSQRRDLNIDLDIMKFVDYVDQQLSSLPK